MRVQGHHPQVATVREVTPVSTQLWEWTVDRGSDSAPTGVCRALDRAVRALSQSLVKASEPASGHIVPLTLVDGARECLYQRGTALEIRADYAEGVITWK
jgi:hypothetical protein